MNALLYRFSSGFLSGSLSEKSRFSTRRALQNALSEKGFAEKTDTFCHYDLPTEAIKPIEIFFVSSDKKRLRIKPELPLHYVFRP